MSEVRPPTSTSNFVNDCSTLPHANTHGCESILLFTPPHFMNERGRNSHAAASERMSESNSSPVYVHLVTIKPKITNARKGLRSEGFVQFNQVKIGNFQAGSLQDFFSSRYRADSHDGWINACQDHGNNSCNW